MGSAASWARPACGSWWPWTPPRDLGPRPAAHTPVAASARRTELRLTQR